MLYFLYTMWLVIFFFFPKKLYTVLRASNSLSKILFIILRFCDHNNEPLHDARYYMTQSPIIQYNIKWYFNISIICTKILKYGIFCNVLHNCEERILCWNASWTEHKVPTTMWRHTKLRVDFNCWYILVYTVWAKYYVQEMSTLNLMY